MREPVVLGAVDVTLDGEVLTYEAVLRRIGPKRMARVCAFLDFDELRALPFPLAKQMTALLQSYGIKAVMRA